MSNDCRFCLEAVEEDDPIDYPERVQVILKNIEERVDDDGSHP